MSNQGKRLTPSSKTLRKLLLRSGNECAFPGCYEVIFNDNDVLVAECCHIEAALNGGERYNVDQTDDERRAYENLLFLCHKHHIETDNIKIYNAAALKKIKSDHENRFREKPILIGTNYIEQVTSAFEEILNTVRDTSERVARIDDNLIALLKSKEKIDVEETNYDEYYGIPPVLLFKGRTKEIGDLYYSFDHYNTFLIGGISGIGKSNLLAQFLKENKTHKSLWIDCETVKTREAFYEYFAKFVRQEFNDYSIVKVLSTSEENVLIRCVLNCLERHLCIIIFDGLDEYINEFNLLLKSFNGNLSQSKVFISSKLNIETILWKNPVHKISLTGLDLETFLSLFLSYRIPAALEQHGIDLYELINGHPFLLKLSVSILQHIPITRFLSQLEKQNSVEISEYIKQKTLEILDEFELVLLMKLSAFIVPFRYDIGDYISGEEFPKLFKSILDKYLIESFRDNFFVIPEFIRTHVLNHCDNIIKTETYDSYVSYLMSVKRNWRFFEGNAIIYHASKADQMDVAKKQAANFLSALMTEGKFNLAFKVASNLELNEKMARWSFVYYVQGRVLRFQQNYELALINYDKAVKLDDDSMDSNIIKFERASILTYLGKESDNTALLDEAKAVYEGLIGNVDKTLTLQCQLSLATIQFNSKQYKDVIDNLESLILTTNFNDILINVHAGFWQILGDAYSQNGDYKKAFLSFDTSCDLYKKAIEKFGMNTIDGLYHLYESYGWAFAKSGNFVSASEMFGLCVELSSQFELGLKKEKALFDYGYHLLLGYVK